jgi:ABC-2 type transport system ATP-binding protein
MTRVAAERAVVAADAGEVTLTSAPPAVGSPPLQAFPLALAGIHKQWRKAPSPVLDGVDLMLDLGTKTWIGGRNGAGKTTLLRIAAGLIDPDRGTVQVWGSGPHERRARYHRLVAFLPAGDRGLYARLTVRRQLRFWAGMAMLEPRVSKERVQEAIDRFDLGALADQRVDRMSMGQRQRVRIAMTFLSEPEVVLLDEPLTSLDAEGAVLLDRAIERLIARGGALLWCSPSGDHPEHQFDDDWILDGGKLVRA